MIGIKEKDAKLIIFLVVLLIATVAFGSFYGGIQYSKDRFIVQSTSELNELLISNFSYVCGGSWDQIYLTNISISLLGIES